MFDSSPENTLRIARLAQERVRLLERLAVIDGELAKNLPTLLLGIAATRMEPLKLAGFVVEVLRAGYTTTARGGLSGMVSQGLKMLAGRGVLNRDRMSGGYVFAGNRPV